MDRSTTIKLIKEEYTRDEIGQYVPTETSTEVFAQENSITRAEWFDAGRNGLKAAVMFTMFGPEYSGELIVEHNGQRYGVYRTYKAKSDKIELYCEEKGGLNGEE